MNREEKLKIIRDKCIEANSDIVELGFGCKIENVFWYKSESDKKKNIVDWAETGHHQDGLGGTVIKDLRKSDYLPMWVDYGDQAEFQIQPDDIVSFNIIGRDLRLTDIIVASEKKDSQITTVSVIEGGITINNKFHDLLLLWDFKKDNLKDQSEECTDFIYNLLK